MPSTSSRASNASLRKRSKRGVVEEVEEDVDFDGSFTEVDVETDSNDLAPSTSEQDGRKHDGFGTCKVEPSVEHHSHYGLRSVKRGAAALQQPKRESSPKTSPTERFSFPRPSIVGPNPNDVGFSFTRNNTLFPFHVYYEILKRAQTDRSIISTELPKLQPPGGSVIIYDCGGGIEQSRALHNDGYRWSRSKGAKMLQSLENKVVRTYHFLYNPSSVIGNPIFKKYRFHLKNDPYGLVVFHYIGDEKQAAAISERWMKKNTQFPSITASENEPREREQSFDLQLEAIVEPPENCSTEEKNKFRTEIVANALDLQRQLLYDDGEQFVDRLLPADEETVRLGGDAVLGPIVLVCHPLMEEMVAVATYLQQSCPFRSVILYYHTEVCSAEYHLSTLSFLHPFFEGEKIVPVAHMIIFATSPTLRDEQDYFFSTIYTKFEDLVNGRFVVVTGQGHSYSPEAFPVAEHVRCWADIKRVTLSCLESEFNVTDELTHYASDMDTLLRSESESVLYETWASISSLKRYSDYPEIQAYFENMLNEFKYSSSIWRLKLVGVADYEDGINWKGSTYLSNVVVQLCENNAQLDTIILSLFFVANTHRRHIMAGLHQSGAWRLKKVYKERFQQSHLKIPRLPFAPPMESVVQAAFGYCHRPFKGESLGFSNCAPFADGSNGVFASPSDAYFDDDSTSAKNSLKASVKLVGMMTFIVRGKDGLPHVVEAKQREENASLQWYCSCASAHRCNHVDDVMFVFKSDRITMGDCEIDSGAAHSNEAYKGDALPVDDKH